MLKNNKNLVKLLVAILVILFMVIIAFSLGTNSTNNKNVKDISKEELITLMDNIKDNYSISVTKTINGVDKTLNYDTDSKLELYDGSLIGEDAILVYKNKKYVVHGNDIKNIKKAKLYEYKGDTSFMKDPFYDLELLKRVINYCELTSINVVKVNCKFNMSDYIKEYNDLYNKKIETTYDNKISMDIVYYEDNIGKFIIDYTDINKAINKNDNTVKYGVKIVSVGENDFTSLFDFFKKYLTK